MRQLTRAESEKLWPIGTRVVISGGNLYELGKITGYGAEQGEPWVETDKGVAWSAFDVNLRHPTEDDLERLEPRKPPKLTITSGTRANRKIMKSIDLVEQALKLHEEKRLLLLELRRALVSQIGTTP